MFTHFECLLRCRMVDNFTLFVNTFTVDYTFLYRASLGGVFIMIPKFCLTPWATIKVSKLIS